MIQVCLFNSRPYRFKLCVSDCPHHNDGSRGSFLTVIIISKTLWGPYGCPVQDSREMHVGPSFQPIELEINIILIMTPQEIF